MPEKPARSFEDFIVNIAKDARPDGVEIIEKPQSRKKLVL